MVQYKAKPIRKNGGGVSGSGRRNLMKGRRGPIKIILIGDSIVDTVDLQAGCDSVPTKDWGG